MYIQFPKPNWRRALMYGRQLMFHIVSLVSGTSDPITLTSPDNTPVQFIERNTQQNSHSTTSWCILIVVCFCLLSWYPNDWIRFLLGPCPSSTSSIYTQNTTNLFCMPKTTAKSAIRENRYTYFHDPFQTLLTQPGLVVDVILGIASVLGLFSGFLVVLKRLLCEFRVEMFGSRSGLGFSADDNIAGTPLEDGACGLENLGNTCYMNSTLQCLSHVPALSAYFLSASYHKHLNANNPLGSKGSIAGAYAALLQDLWSNYYESVSPDTFHDCFTSVKQQFGGGMQHDAEEFLGALLDALHEDLNQGSALPHSLKDDVEQYAMCGADTPNLHRTISQSSAVSGGACKNADDIVEFRKHCDQPSYAFQLESQTGCQNGHNTSQLSLNLSNSVHTSADDGDKHRRRRSSTVGSVVNADDASIQAWDEHTTRNHSIITDKFTGQLCCRTRCPKCEHTSTKFDCFSVLTLPLPESQLSVRLRLIYDLDMDAAEIRLRLSACKHKYRLALTQASKGESNTKSILTLINKCRKELDARAKLRDVLRRTPAPIRELYQPQYSSKGAYMAEYLLRVPQNATVGDCLKLLAIAADIPEGYGIEMWSMTSGLFSHLVKHEFPLHKLRAQFAVCQVYKQPAATSRALSTQIPKQVTPPLHVLIIHRRFAWYKEDDPFKAFIGNIRTSTDTKLADLKCPEAENVYEGCYDVFGIPYAMPVDSDTQVRDLIAAAFEWAYQAWESHVRRLRNNPNHLKTSEQVNKLTFEQVAPEIRPTNIKGTHIGPSLSSLADNDDFLLVQQNSATDPVTLRFPAVAIDWGEYDARKTVKHTIEQVFKSNTNLIAKNDLQLSSQLSQSDQTLLYEDLYNHLPMVVEAPWLHSFSAEPDTLLFANVSVKAAANPTSLQSQLSQQKLPVDSLYDSTCVYAPFDAYAAWLKAQRNHAFPDMPAIERAECQLMEEEALLLQSGAYGPVETGSTTLQHCLSNFQEEERLSSDNMYTCEQCNEQVQAQRSVLLWRTPDVFIVLLKRFVFLDDFGTSQKNDTLVSFPLRGLDLSPWIRGGADNRWRRGRHAVWPPPAFPPNSPGCASLEPVYDLSGVVMHAGTLGSGHYTAYVENPLSGSWHLYNDHIVQRVATPQSSTSNHSMNHNAGIDGTDFDVLQSMLHSPDAYVLIYSRRGTSESSLTHFRTILEQQLATKRRVLPRYPELTGFQESHNDKEDEMDLANTNGTTDTNHKNERVFPRYPELHQHDHPFDPKDKTESSNTNVSIDTTHKKEV